MGLLANGNIRTKHGNEYTQAEWELKKQLETEEFEIDESKAAQAEKTFCATLTAAGMDGKNAARLAAMGPMLILRKLESGEMKCSTPEKESLLEKAVNAWGRSIY